MYYNVLVPPYIVSVEIYSCEYTTHRLGPLLISELEIKVYGMYSADHSSLRLVFPWPGQSHDFRQFLVRDPVTYCTIF